MPALGEVTVHTLSAPLALSVQRARCTGVLRTEVLPLHIDACAVACVKGRAFLPSGGSAAVLSCLFLFGLFQQCADLGSVIRV